MCGRPSERITNKCVKSIIIHGISGKMLSFSVIRFIHAVTMATCIFLFCSSLTFSFIKKMFGLSRQRRYLDLPTVYLFSFALWGVHVCRGVGVGVGVFWECLCLVNEMPWLNLKTWKKKKRENKKKDKKKSTHTPLVPWLRIPDQASLF